MMIPLLLSFAGQIAPLSSDVANPLVRKTVAAMGYVSEGEVVWRNLPDLLRTQGVYVFQHAGVYGKYSPSAKTVVAATSLLETKRRGSAALEPQDVLKGLTTLFALPPLAESLIRGPYTDESETVWYARHSLGGIPSKDHVWIKMNEGVCEAYLTPTPIRGTPAPPKINLKQLKKILKGVEVKDASVSYRAKSPFDLTPITVYSILVRRESGLSDIVEVDARTGQVFRFPQAPTGQR
ncbi:hypothetical protein EON79_04685 [bacterium]|nr:MAG: hypothetical protein EON79_04685 [bacterium]